LHPLHKDPRKEAQVMKPDFESRAERNTAALSEVEKKLYTSLVLPQEAEAIDPRSFNDLYDKGVIEADLRRVSELEAKFKAEAKNDPDKEAWDKRGKLFEAIVRDQTEMSDWMGETARVIVPSRYDDIVSGVDGIVEFDDETSKTHLVLAVDVTESELGLNRKFEKISESIRRGSLSRVKYFRSESMRGELTLVPRVVIGADRRSMDEVAELLLEFKTTQKGGAQRGGKESERFREARRRLAESDMQYKILMEMKEQLIAFRDYARIAPYETHEAAGGKKDIVAAYDRVLTLISSVLEGKPEAELKETRDRLERDGVFNLILEKSRKIGEHNKSGGIVKATIK